MDIEFKYQKHIDLIYHVLAHIKVNNASDLFSLKYIKRFERLRNNKSLSISSDLTEYYNGNFGRLAMINFLPFYSNSFEQLKQILLNYRAFTSDDIEVFIKPFLSICENESAFYFTYWESEINIITEKCVFTERAITDKLKPYKSIFSYYNKSALILFSLSITRNGRGLAGINNSFSALIPFPLSPERIFNSFFTLLHEYTHQITDELLRTNINMQDGSHDISESMVILFDYYLIKYLNEIDVKEYLKWISEISGNTNETVTEDLLLSAFKVPDLIGKEMNSLFKMITGSQI